MEKTETKKLTVNKNTVRELGEKELRGIVGGGHISTYCSGGSTATCTDRCSDMNTLEV